MKKIILMTVVGIFIILSTSYGILNLWLNKDSQRFNVQSAKKEVIQYLKQNKKELEKIAKELYEEKTSKKSPYPKISYSQYKNDTDLSFLEKLEYIQFDVDAQGFLGGQYYGLIYSKDDHINDRKDMFIYEQYKEEKEGNNIFIREKIDEYWFYYYNDYDGKVDIEKIKKEN